MQISNSESKQNPDLFRFLVITFGFSWLIWVGIVLASPMGETPTIVMTVFAAFGPTLAAIVLISFFSTKVQRRSYWNRVINVRLVSWKWYVSILFLFPMMYFAAYTAYVVFLGGAYPPMEGLQEATESIGILFGYIALMLLGGPLAEELGWRGYALEPILKKFGALNASFVIAIIWAIWHLPLFFVPGSPQNVMGFGGEFLGWMIEVLALSFLLTWAFIENSKSILLAVYIHLVSNLTYSAIIPVFTPTGYSIPFFVSSSVTVLHVVMAFVVVFVLAKNTFLGAGVAEAKES